MIEYRSDPASNIVELVVDGKITKEQIDTTFARMKPDLDRHEKIRMLEEIRSLDGIDPAAMWEDLKLGVPMIGKMSHVAIVADQKWIQNLTGLARHFISAEIRTFEPTEIEEARAWLASA